MNKEEVEDMRSKALIGEATDSSVRQVFAILGVDVDKPEQIEDFREDLRFGRRMRKAAGHGMLAVVSLLVVALMTATWYGVVDAVRKVHP